MKEKKLDHEPSGIPKLYILIIECFIFISVLHFCVIFKQVLYKNAHVNVTQHSNYNIFVTQQNLAMYFD